MKKTVSILKEKGIGEKRVIIVPEQIHDFIQNDFEVFVEKNAGIEIGFTDEDYQKRGAKLVDTERAWNASSFILKYKPPIKSEYKYLRSNLNLCAIFHAEGDMDLISALLKSKVTAYSYEFFKSSNGTFPLAIVGGEIAGKLAIIYGAYHLQSQFGGEGVLLTSLPNVKRPKVLIIGHGNAGGAAAKMAFDMGCDVVVLGRDNEKMRRFSSQFNQPIRVEKNTPEILNKELKDADLVIGTILISTFDTPPMITENHLKLMKRGAMIVDVTCGYGKGYLSTFDNFTSAENPTFIKEGILHCKIDVLPSFVPKTSSIAYSKNAISYLVNLGNSFFDKNIIDMTSQNGKVISNGMVTHDEIKRHIEFYTDG